MVPLSNLIMALAVVRNGVYKMKGLFSSSLMSRITKSTGYTCSTISTNTSSGIPKGWIYEWLASESLMYVSAGLWSVDERDGIYAFGDEGFGLFSNQHLFKGPTGCKFLKNPDHFSHPAIDLLALLENGIFKSFHSFTIMVVESEVLNEFPKFIGILFAEFAAGGGVNLSLKMKGDMIIKYLDFKPTIDAMIRDFL
nr:hypothetical protein [Tanacetum cinerariifolium]